MFEKFRKKKDEFNPDPTKKEDFTTTQHQQPEIESEENAEVIEQPKPEPARIIEQPTPTEQVKIPEPMQQRTMSGEDIGIRALMDKRTKLEEAID
ncbi:MAG: hypothetical protein KGJ07_10455, partial [Patescibacteria group bacterium]|nr:hypothetical protein [Patescibacteria group bacterium]